MSSSNMNTAEEKYHTPEQFVPDWVCQTVLVLDVLILVGNCTGFSLLLRFISTSPKKFRAPSHVFFFCISVASLFASLIGIPVSIVAASNKYQNEVITSASQYMQSRTLLLCFSLVIHYLTCITTERYLKITSRTQKISARHSKRIVAIVTVYVFSLSSIIILNDLCLLPNLTCSNKLWFLYKQTRTDGFSKNSTVSTAYSGNPAYGGSSQVPVIITTMWMTICNTVLNTTTVATVRFIKKSVRNMEKSIGTSTKRFETRRLKIVYALSTFFSILWIPYGVINGQQEKLDPKVKKALHILMETYCYASFVAIPLAIYIMDKRFASFIKSFLRRG